MIAQKLKEKVGRSSLVPTLAVIQIGSLPESTAYITQKKKFAEKIGASVNHIVLDEDVGEIDVLAEIKKLNADISVHGIIVQMPIPKHLNRWNIIEAITPTKDVDGLTSTNTKALWDNRRGFVPATARGVLSLLSYYDISVAGKKIVVIGRSVLVGKPTALLLLNHDATVTICHSKTKDVAEVTHTADIIVVAAGVPNLITADYVSPRQVVIDVGINVSAKKLEDEIGTQKLTGDVDFEAVSGLVSAISPVPGGVGPMTVASLFENVVEALEAVVRR